MDCSIMGTKRKAEDDDNSGGRGRSEAVRPRRKYAQPTSKKSDKKTTNTKLGKYLGGILGGGVGAIAGHHLGHITGVGVATGHKVGKDIGEILGDLLPFKKGGRIKSTGPIYAHKGEFVLPAGVEPTTHQIRIVKMKHSKK
jgi:hypothetical protein